MTTETTGATPPPLDEPGEKTGMRNAWGRIAEQYERMWTERTAHLTARGLDLLDPDPGWDGCDIGCGPGVTARALADRLPRGHTLGVDFAEPMVVQARERFTGPQLSFAVDDAENLSGLYINRLDAGRQAEVRDAMLAHVAAVAEQHGDALAAPAEVAVVVARRDP